MRDARTCGKNLLDLIHVKLTFVPAYAVPTPAESFRGLSTGVNDEKVISILLNEGHQLLVSTLMKVPSKLAVIVAWFKVGSNKAVATS